MARENLMYLCYGNLDIVNFVLLNLSTLSNALKEKHVEYSALCCITLYNMNEEDCFFNVRWSYVFDQLQQYRIRIPYKYR